MSYEDRYFAQSDYNAELRGEGHEEGRSEGIALAVEKLRAVLVNKAFSNLKADIMLIIDELEGE